MVVFMGIIQKAWFGSEGALAGYFQDPVLLQDMFRDLLPWHLA